MNCKINHKRHQDMDVEDVHVFILKLFIIIFALLNINFRFFFWLELKHVDEQAYK